jgi:hypothetical protein
MAVKYDPEANRPLINATAGSHSSRKLVDDAGKDLTGWDVKKKNPADKFGTVTDNHGGEWTAKVCTKPKPKKTSQVWLMLTCVKAPRTKDDRGPDSGDLTITLAKAGSVDLTVTPPTTVDYSNDTPPP